MQVCGEPPEKNQVLCLRSSIACPEQEQIQGSLDTPASTPRFSGHRPTSLPPNPHHHHHHYHHLSSLTNLPLYNHHHIDNSLSSSTTSHDTPKRSASHAVQHSPAFPPSILRSPRSFERTLTILLLASQKIPPAQDHSSPTTKAHFSPGLLLLFCLDLIHSSRSKKQFRKKKALGSNDTGVARLNKLLFLKQRPSRVLRRLTQLDTSTAPLPVPRLRRPMR